MYVYTYLIDMQRTPMNMRINTQIQKEMQKQKS